MRGALVVVTLALAGCLNYRTAAQFCDEQGRCKPLPEVPSVACVDGFCWEHPFPHAYDYDSVTTPGPGEVWAVGEATSVTHLKDGGWSFEQPRDPTWPATANPRVLALAVTGGGEVATLDSDGRIRVRSGVGWSTKQRPSCMGTPYPAGRPLAANASGLYLGGRCASPDGGTVAWLGRLNEPDWSWTALWTGGSSTANLWALNVDEPGGVWATGEGKVVSAFDGGVVEDDLPQSPAMAVAPQPDGGVLVAGEGFCAVREASGAWSLDAGPGRSSGAARLGRQTLLSWDGGLASCAAGTCGCETIWRTPFPLTAVAAGTEAWAVGRRGLLARVEGDGTVTELAPGTRSALTVIWVAGGEAWAGGAKGTLMHRTAEGWRELGGFSHGGPVTGIVPLGDGRLLVAAHDGVLGTWSDEGFETAEIQQVDGSKRTESLGDLRTLASAGPESTWAVGHGYVLRYLPRQRAWRAVFYEEARQWSEAWATSSGLVWVGAGGALRRVTAKGFTEETLPVECDIYGIWGVSPENPFLLCRENKVYRRARAGVFEEVLPKMPGFNGGPATSISGTAEDDFWVSGKELVMHYGRPAPGAEPQWQVHRLWATELTIHQVLVSAGSVWAVGDRGAIFRHKLQ